MRIRGRRVFTAGRTMAGRSSSATSGRNSDVSEPLAHPCEITIASRSGAYAFRGWCFACPWKGPKRYTQSEVAEDISQHIAAARGEYGEYLENERKREFGE